jgi:hypothetical protein
MTEPRTLSPLRRLRLRSWIILSPFLVVLDICGLVTVNDPSNSPHGGSNLGANLFLGIGLVFLVAGTWYSVRLLRNSR